VGIFRSCQSGNPIKPKRSAAMDAPDLTFARWAFILMQVFCTWAGVHALCTAKWKYREYFPGKKALSGARARVLGAVLLSSVPLSFIALGLVSRTKDAEGRAVTFDYAVIVSVFVSLIVVYAVTATLAYYWGVPNAKDSPSDA
jgi:hypothetical protein